MPTRENPTPPADETDAVGVEGGRKASTYTDVHDWVTFSAVSPGAKALYVILRAHVNRQRADDTVWTSTLALAKIMNLSRGDKIKPYTNELLGIDAIKMKGGGKYNRNVYLVHEQPPVGYAGPKTPGEWHAMNKPMLKKIRDAENKARDERRAKAKVKKAEVAVATPPKTPRGRRNPSSAPVHPKTGEQVAEPVVPPYTGELVPPDTGELVHPISGREPDVCELDVLEPDDSKKPPVSLTSADAVASVVAEAETGGNPNDNPSPRNNLDTLADEISVAGGWPFSTTRDVLEALRTAGKHSPDEIVRVMRAVAAGEHGPTQTPRRLLSWWPTQPKLVETPAWVEGPRRHLAPGTPMCRKHRGEPEGACGPCKVDDWKDPADMQATRGPRLPAADARALARDAALKARTRKVGPTRMPRQADPERMGPPPEAFGAVAGRIAAAAGSRS